MSNDSGISQKCSIYIVGPQNLQNEFYTYVIQKELSYPCYLFDKDLRPVRVGIDPEKANQDDRILMLIDNEEHSFEDILPLLASHPRFADAFIALINMKENVGIEKRALKKNVRGFFYKDDQLEIFLKGVRTILTGEVWISRSVLLQCVLDGLRENKDTAESKNSLTAREVEILTLVCRGASNDDIARKMFISTNTVKTHLYNIYKKIHVSSRLQASQWAAANISV